MAYKISLYRSAIIDFQEAEEWYRQKSLKVAKRFVQRYLKLIQNIQSNPFQYPLVYQDIRNAKFGKSFSAYSLLFYVSEDILYIVAVFHGKRDARTWQERITS